MTIENRSAETFSLIVLPDTQIYSVNHPELFYDQAKWVAENSQSFNIKMVLHEGDVVHSGGRKEEQWVNAKNAMDLIYEAAIPTVTAIGNHDYDDLAQTRASTKFNEYFGLERYEGQSWYGGAFESDKTENIYAFFSDGNQQYMVLSLEFGPRQAVVDWANELLAQHQGKRTILLTHNYMYIDDTRSQPGHKWNPKAYGIGDDAHDGEDLWQKLVKHHENIFLVLNGHNLGRGLGYRVDEGIQGNRVHQILANYQNRDNGGQGFLRIMKFRPDETAIDISTYSPTLDEYKTDPDNQFTLELD